jgi:ABC-type antimicrobial peptide transport system permease subunit
VFFLSYVAAELRRRRGRTLLTALGLGVGVGLVVAVSALSDGLDRAQSTVLKPLTGVGTDLSATRPVNLKGGILGISAKERKQLEDENPVARINLNDLGTPGERFSRTDFITVAQLSFPADVVEKVRALDGVKAATGALTLNSLSSSGIVPKPVPGSPNGFGGPGSPPPEDLELKARSVTGIDLTAPSVAPLTPAQVIRGRYLKAAGEVVVNDAYAKREGLTVGKTLRLDEVRLTVVGIARAPLGGQSSDLYVALGVLQTLSERKDRVNTLNVRAASTDDVARVQRGIKTVLEGASVTTAAQLADRVGGSLRDAQKLSDKLGTALAVVAMIAALLIASLLTLSGISKRTRELGTLKAIGWPQRLVVRQITGEALVTGLIGAVFGVLIGLAGVAAIDALGISLEASVAGSGGAVPGLPAGGGEQAGVVQSIFGQGGVETGARDVKVDAAIDGSLLALAVGLAVLVGLLSGAAGALRAARLRPADALRQVD